MVYFTSKIPYRLLTGLLISYYIKRNFNSVLAPKTSDESCYDKLPRCRGLHSIDPRLATSARPRADQEDATTFTLLASSADPRAAMNSVLDVSI